MAAVDLYWLPLGAGGHFVRLNGRLYEALAARLQRRPPRDLYHSALQIELPEGTYVVEQAPVHDGRGKDRGVVAEGPVGARWAGRFRIFRYEIRLWRSGHIPDVAEAVDSPKRLSNEEDRARGVLDVVHECRLRHATVVPDRETVVRRPPDPTRIVRAARGLIQRGRGCQLSTFDLSG